MERLTYFDYLANCYKIKPDAQQRLIIQRLGKYEDARAAVNAAELQKILENLKDETLEVSTIKGDAWTAGFNEGIRVAEEIIKGAIHD